MREEEREGKKGRKEEEVEGKEVEGMSDLGGRIRAIKSFQSFNHAAKSGQSLFLE